MKASKDGDSAASSAAPALLASPPVPAGDARQVAADSTAASAPSTTAQGEQAGRPKKKAGRGNAS